MRRFNYDAEIYHNNSIVDLVKMQQAGVDIFPENVDIVTGGFPCQDFSVAGKRLGFNSKKTIWVNTEQKMSHQKKHVVNYISG